MVIGATRWLKAIAPLTRRSVQLRTLKIGERSRRIGYLVGTARPVQSRMITSPPCLPVEDFRGIGRFKTSQTFFKKRMVNANRAFPPSGGNLKDRSRDPSAPRLTRLRNGESPPGKPGAGVGMSSGSNRLNVCFSKHKLPCAGLVPYF